MTRTELIQFLRRYKLAVIATLGARGASTPEAVALGTAAPGAALAAASSRSIPSLAAAPQAAVVGFAVSDQLELVFDTLESTRKYGNLVADPRVALVIGWDDAITAQIEGVADVLAGPELARLRDVYFGPYPDGRERLASPMSVCAPPGFA